MGALAAAARLTCWIAIAGACATGEPPTREPVATLRVAGQPQVFHYPTTLAIMQVDGRLTAGSKEVELAPGWHSLTVSIFHQLHQGESRRASGTLSIEVVAGRRYRLNGTLQRGKALLWVVDEGTGEVVAGETP
jgi:hypothetical protein